MQNKTLPEYCTKIAETQSRKNALYESSFFLFDVNPLIEKKKKKILRTIGTQFLNILLFIRLGATLDVS